MGLGTSGTESEAKAAECLAPLRHIFLSVNEELSLFSFSKGLVRVSNVCNDQLLGWFLQSISNFP